MSKARYFKVSPRGFQNEVIYFYALDDETAGEIESYFEGFEDDNPGSIATWTTDKVARARGVAVHWDDRAYVGF